MGFFSRLFGSPKPVKTPEELQALEEEEARRREESRKQVEQDIMRVNMLHKSIRMVDAFGGFMADILDAGAIKKPPIYLYPESALPCQKKDIEIAFAIVFMELEKTGKEEIFGITTSKLRIAKMLLEQHFAPNEEVPDDPHLNLDAYMEWQLKINPYLRKKSEDFKNEIRDHPERIPEILKEFEKRQDFYKSLPKLSPLSPS
jgi:hypothetical protein